MVKKRVKRKVSHSTQKKSKMPVWVRVISILYFISAVMAIFAGLVFIIGGAMGGEVVERIGSLLTEATIDADPNGAWFVSLLLSSLVLGGVLLVMVGVIEALIATGLWRGRKWARIVIIVLACLGFVSSILQLDIFGIIITGIIGSYLAFSPKVKNSFK